LSVVSRRRWARGTTRLIVIRGNSAGEQREVRYFPVRDRSRMRAVHGERMLDDTLRVRALMVS